jgi:hypothetical protein
MGLWIGMGAGGMVLVAAIVVLIILLSGGKNEQAKAKPAPKAEAQPAPEPAAQQPPPKERNPNAGLAGIARTWTEQEMKYMLTNLGIAYKNCSAFTGKGPADQKELSSYYENNAKINEALAKGWIVFQWKAGPQQMPQGASNTVLAYESDPDRHGSRWVLRGDGSVTREFEEDFQKMPKAGK